MAVRESKEVSDIARALRATLISPNVSDQNFEAANVVDAVNYIAMAISRLAQVHERYLEESNGIMVRQKEAIGDVVEAIGDLAEAIRETKGE